MKTRFVVLAAAVLLLMSASAFAEEYSFEVTNRADMRITHILVSEDGEDYGYFDIGSGIAPRKTVTLTWDSSTDGELCVQYIVAVFADDSESEPQQFDFCEDGLELEFE
ncbi:MAG: hypothetical protein ACRD2J_02015 [Thermoanaerobaculia bacterium]